MASKCHFRCQAERRCLRMRSLRNAETQPHLACEYRDRAPNEVPTSPVAGSQSGGYKTLRAAAQVSGVSASIEKWNLQEASLKRLSTLRLPLRVLERRKLDQFRRAAGAGSSLSRVQGAHSALSGFQSSSLRLTSISALMVCFYRSRIFPLDVDKPRTHIKNGCYFTSAHLFTPLHGPPLASSTDIVLKSRWIRERCLYDSRSELRTVGGERR